MDYKLRNWELTDAADLARNANNVRIAENLRNTFPNPYTPRRGMRSSISAIAAGRTRAR